MSEIINPPNTFSGPPFQSGCSVCKPSTDYYSVPHKGGKNSQEGVGIYDTKNSFFQTSFGGKKTVKKPVAKKPIAKKPVAKKAKKMMKGGQESSGATPMDSRFFNPNAHLADFPELPGSVKTAYGNLESGNVGTGMLAPYNSSTCSTVNTSSMTKTGGKKSVKKGGNNDVRITGGMDYELVKPKTGGKKSAKKGGNNDLRITGGMDYELVKPKTGGKKKMKGGKNEVLGFEEKIYANANGNTPDTKGNLSGGKNKKVSIKKKQNGGYDIPGFNLKNYSEGSAEGSAENNNVKEVSGVETHLYANVDGTSPTPDNMGLKGGKKKNKKMKGGNPFPGFGGNDSVESAKHSDVSISMLKHKGGAVDISALLNNQLTTPPPANYQKLDLSCVVKQVGSSKKKKLHGGQESSGATPIHSRFYNPDAPLADFPAIPESVNTQYGKLESGNVGTGMLVPYNAAPPCVKGGANINNQQKLSNWKKYLNKFPEEYPIYKNNLNSAIAYFETSNLLKNSPNLVELKKARNNKKNEFNKNQPSEETPLYNNKYKYNLYKQRLLNWKKKVTNDPTNYPSYKNDLNAAITYYNYSSNFKNSSNLVELKEARNRLKNGIAQMTSPQLELATANFAESAGNSAANATAVAATSEALPLEQLSNPLAVVSELNSQPLANAVLNSSQAANEATGAVGKIINNPGNRQILEQSAVTAANAAVNAAKAEEQAITIANKSKLSNNEMQKRLFNWKEYLKNPFKPYNEYKNNLNKAIEYYNSKNQYKNSANLVELKEARNRLKSGLTQMTPVELASATANFAGSAATSAANTTVMSGIAEGLPASQLQKVENNAQLATGSVKSLNLTSQRQLNAGLKQVASSTSEVAQGTSEVASQLTNQSSSMSVENSSKAVSAAAESVQIALNNLGDRLALQQSALQAAASAIAAAKEQEKVLQILSTNVKPQEGSGEVIPRVNDGGVVAVQRGINSAIDNFSGFLAELDKQYLASVNSAKAVKFGDQNLIQGGSKKQKKSAPKKQKKVAPKKKISKKQKGGSNGSDFAATLNSRGPANWPDDHWGVPGDVWFRQFNKTGEYIPNSQLPYAATPTFAGKNNTGIVTGFDDLGTDYGHVN